MNMLKAITIVSLASAALFTACEQEKSAADPARQAEIAALAKAPQGSSVNDWFFIEEHNWLPVLGDFPAKLRETAQAFESGKKKAAADALRQTAALLNQKTAAAKGANRKTKTSISELEGLAKLLESRRPIQDPKQLHAALVKAYFAYIAEAYVPAKEDYWVPLMQEPEIYFKTAEREFTAKEMKKAAVDLQRGLVFLKCEAARASDKSKDFLFLAVQDLSQMSVTLENGYPITEPVFKKYLSRAHQALARTHYQKADQDWLDKKQKEAAQELKAAFYHLELAASWAAYQFPRPVQKALKEGQDMVETMQANGKVPTAKFVSTLGKLNQELTSLDKETFVERG